MRQTPKFCGAMPHMAGRLLRVGVKSPAILPPMTGRIGDALCCINDESYVTRLGANAGELVVEGGFAANSAYRSVLAALRPPQRVFAGGDAAGTAEEPPCSRTGQLGTLTSRQDRLLRLRRSRASPLIAPRGAMRSDEARFCVAGPPRMHRNEHSCIRAIRLMPAMGGAGRRTKPRRRPPRAN
jgi:hypothetical protein